MKHLLVVALGPVQDFIAAARRTQDLQAGSQLLVELAKAVAKALVELGAEPIFPADLKKDGPNKVLVVLPAAVDPALAAQRAKQAARDALRRAWEEALPTLRPYIDLTRAQKQIDSFLECAVAWAPYEEGGYSAARRCADLRLAGRKALRDFPSAEGTPGIHKSPLDPARESVLSGANGRVPQGASGYPLWLKETEMLDALSLLKRWRGAQARVGSIPSTGLMAVRGILPALEQAAPSTLAEIESLVRAENEKGIDLGDVFFVQRSADRGESWEAAAKALRRTALKAVHRGECPPYFAILVADGDRMGEKLDQCDSQAQHQTLSRQLAEFATQAGALVREAAGHLVYSGGDDVLAFLPVPTAISCAASLAASFQAGIGGTLSVGIAIVHQREPLRFSLDRAREVEQLAKRTRNSLAVVLHTRGGSPIHVSDSWTANPQDNWKYWATHLSGELARGAPYELRELAREFAGTGLTSESLNAEVKRILDRKSGGKIITVPKLADVDALVTLADRMIIARFLATYERGGQNE